MTDPILKEAVEASYKAVDPLIAHIREGYADGLTPEEMFASLFWKIAAEKDPPESAALLATAALFRAALDR